MREREREMTNTDIRTHKETNLTNRHNNRKRYDKKKVSIKH